MVISSWPPRLFILPKINRLMKNSFWALSRRLFTGAGFLQTIVLVTATAALFGFYTSSYFQKEKHTALAETPMCWLPGGQDCRTGDQGTCYSRAGSGCYWQQTGDQPWIGDCRCPSAPPDNEPAPTTAGGGRTYNSCADLDKEIDDTNTADPNCGARNGMSCKDGSGFYCCYHNGDCQQGGTQTQVVCSGTNIKNNTGSKITADVYAGCHNNNKIGTKDIPAGESRSAGRCTQLDVWNYCGVCNWDANCEATTPTPTKPTNTPTPTGTPTSTPTSTPTPTGTIATPTPTNTPTPTATPTPPLLACGNICSSNWNGSPQSSNECPQDAPTCYAFSTSEWRCVINPSWNDYGCTPPGSTPTPTPTKPQVLGASVPPVMPKAGLPTELTVGLLQILGVGVILRIALLLL